MRLDEFLKQKVKAGQDASFLEGKTKNGRVLIISVNEKNYVVHASIENFTRFKDWVGKEAIVDIRRTGKFHKVEDYGRLPTVNIRTKADTKEPVEQQTQDEKTPNNQDDTIVY